jgi:alpha-L-rhamnosidase
MKTLLATAYWAHDCSMLARIARELGRSDDAARFAGMFAAIRAAFQREWLLGDGQLAVETQTAYLLALAFDLLPREVRSSAARRLADNLREQGFHLSTGFIGVGHLNPQLTLAGHADVAYRLLLQDTYPAWLYPVKNGATTIWERWNGWTEEAGFFNPFMNSFNHYSLGSVGEWLFRHVAGIELDTETPGSQHFALCPFVGDGLSYVRARMSTLHGEVVSGWRKEPDRLIWSIRIPANTSAAVGVPAGDPASISLDGLPLSEHPLAQHVQREAGRSWLTLPAGAYDFVCLLSAVHEDADGL